eukprot:CAMPEP_0171302622 /NCGR_PEP_ID=MMETSP0816-20121228/12044_1 /TAXON_ID=420281 /ORGANISM="Proboscia inermis, Strain CCAP1064/1" /LENGTH=194 /DNA_ID=CAMNT_0011781239 /DNA_START=53 /DNA_END=637 /DNA_ORIENTATION=-
MRKRSLNDSPEIDSKNLQVINEEGEIKTSEGNFPPQIQPYQPTSKTTGAAKPKRLSNASNFYDVEGKGYLSMDQQILRNLDIVGDGKLDPSELAPLVKQYNELLKDNNALRKNQKLLGATTIFFGIATIVATVIAIMESKETVICSDGLLASKNTGIPVITQSMGVHIVSELHGDYDYETAEVKRVAATYKLNI